MCGAVCFFGVRMFSCPAERRGVKSLFLPKMNRQNRRKIGQHCFNRKPGKLWKTLCITLKTLINSRVLSGFPRQEGHFSHDFVTKHNI